MALISITLPRQQWSLLNRIRMEQGHCGACRRKWQITDTVYRHWSVSLWRDPGDVSHCRILSPDKTEWRLISATLCGWRRCFLAGSWNPYEKTEHMHRMFSLTNFTSIVSTCPRLLLLDSFYFWAMTHGYVGHSVCQSTKWCNLLQVKTQMFHSSSAPQLPQKPANTAKH